MKVKLLGTAAAEGWPALFCNCGACYQARKLGGKNLRSRSSVLIDGVLKIDLPPDTFHHICRYGLDLSELRWLLLTHSHKDHFAADEFLYLGPDFARRKGLKALEVYGNNNVMKKLREYSDQGLHAVLREIEPFDELRLGPYRVLPVLARHGSDLHPLNYVISRGGSHLLYACDTGYYPDATWQRLADYEVDAVIVECTGGPRKLDYGTHMGLPDVLAFKKKAEAIGLAGPDTKWVLTHMSHFGGALHGEMQERCKRHDIVVGYDGLDLEV